MLRGMYSSVSAMINLQSSQSVITNNLANINTTGYKSETLVSKSFEELMISNRDRYVNGQGKTQEIGGLSLGVKIDDTITNHMQGTFIETNNKTDFAINGKGFFTVRDTAGKEFYTRDGVFKVNSQGYLVTTAGHYVVGRNQNTNTVEPIYVGNQKVTVDNNNNLLLNSQVSYKFNVVDFENYDKLNKVGDNLYYSENPRVTNNYNLKQGVKESSNVNLIDATSELMANLRAFEANQKVVQIMDSALSKIANEIGAVR